MEMRKAVLALAAACFGLLSAPARADLAITVGDSIVRDYPEYPCCNWAPIEGWGQALRPYFKPELQWRNDAWGGESTTSFLADGRWQATIAAQPRFILIMFGISDAQEDPNYHADANTLYRQNLHRMAVEARAIGAEPIFVTPTPIRYAAYDGWHVYRPNGLEDWANAVVAQGAEDGVGVVDLQYWLMGVYDEIGMPTAQALYGFIIPQWVIPSLPPDTPDQLHLTPYGADQAALHIIGKLPQISPNLAAFLAQPTVPALSPWAAMAFVAMLGLALAAGVRARR